MDWNIQTLIYSAATEAVVFHSISELFLVWLPRDNNMAVLLATPRSIPEDVPPRGSKLFRSSEFISNSPQILVGTSTVLQTKGQLPSQHTDPQNRPPNSIETQRRQPTTSERLEPYNYDFSLFKVNHDANNNGAAC